MDQVLRTALLWALGSRNPALDCTRIQRRQPVLTIPSAPIRSVIPAETSASATLGRTFEDRVIHDVLPQVAAKLKIVPASRMWKITRHVPHSGDLAIHYAAQVGLLELKNHARALPIIDRRRFFDSILVHYIHLDWAILVTSRCSVPHFSERGYTVVGNLCIDLPGQPSKNLPLAFICGLDTLGPGALETAIRSVTGQRSPCWTEWKISELLSKGEATRSVEAKWGSGDGAAFRHPAGAVF